MRDEKQHQSEPEPAQDDFVRLLDEAAACEAEERAAAEKLADAPGLRSVERILAEQWGGHAAHAGGRSNYWRWGVALAAAVLVVFFVSRWRAPEPTGGDGPSGQYLGHEGFEVLAPRGRVEAWPKTITWRADDLAHEYEVQVLDDETGDVLIDLGRTIATEIDFPSEDAVAWPKVIEVTVTALRKDATKASQSARVELVR